LFFELLIQLRSIRILHRAGDAAAKYIDEVFGESPAVFAIVDDSKSTAYDSA